MKEHPRLLADNAVWQRLRTARGGGTAFGRFLARLEEDGYSLLATPSLGYEKKGRRLLYVSRQALERIVLWSLNYQLTRDIRFRDRAEQEMLVVCAFPDWNPDHFLDVAEMLTALAVGYDWLYDVLSERSKGVIREAIVEKGVLVGTDLQGKQAGWWYTAEMNWNSVCLGGLTLAALAIADEEPDLAERMLDQVRAHCGYGMKPYAPNGNYGEGPMYWSYGTTYEVILIASLESALGTDWGLSDSPGFLASAEYLLEVTGPSGLPFNYSDSRETSVIEPALFWFAGKLGSRDVLYRQRLLLDAYLERQSVSGGELAANRFLPLIALWASDFDDSTLPGRSLAWSRGGQNPVAVFRNGWSENGLYLALKGGSAAVSHGHMDAGSFVLEANGVRWVRDLGLQEYDSLESKGIDLWDGSQGGARWSIFRLSNFGHNTLTINKQLHRVEGKAEIVRFSGTRPGEFHAVVDLSEVFRGQAGKVLRNFSVLENEDVVIQDGIWGLEADSKVTWTIVTGAEVCVRGNLATLNQQGKEMYVRLSVSVDSQFETIAVDEITRPFDAPNPGKSLLVANFRAPQSGQIQIHVQFSQNRSLFDARRPVNSASKREERVPASV